MHTSKKIVLVGHFGVGKSSLIRRFVEDTFSDNYKVTIGVHIFKKDIEIKDEILSLIIWDIEGNDDIKKARSSYLLGTNGFIYVFDITRIESSNNIQQEINYIKETYSKSKVKVVANKTDLLKPDNLKQKKEEFKPFVDFFTSAKTGSQVEKLFHSLGKDLIL